MKWINRSDKSPPNGTEVLVVVNDPDYNIINPLIDILTFFDGSYWCKYGSDMQFTLRVTHWMPLPRLPSEANIESAVREILSDVERKKKAHYEVTYCRKNFKYVDAKHFDSELSSNLRKHDMDCTISECTNVNCGGDFVPDKIVCKFYVATGKDCL